MLAKFKGVKVFTATSVSYGKFFIFFYFSNGRHGNEGDDSTLNEEEDGNIKA